MKTEFKSLLANIKLQIYDLFSDRMFKFIEQDFKIASRRRGWGMIQLVASNKSYFILMLINKKTEFRCYKILLIVLVSVHGGLFQECGNAVATQGQI